MPPPAIPIRALASFVSTSRSVSPFPGNSTKFFSVSSNNPSFSCCSSIFCKAFITVPVISGSRSSISRKTIRNLVSSTKMGETVDESMDAVQRKLMFEDECILVNEEDHVIGHDSKYNLDYLVFIVRDVALHPNPEEVADVKYVNKEQLKELIRKADAGEDGVKLSPWFRLVVDNFLIDWWNKTENGTLADAIDMKTIHKLT